MAFNFRALLTNVASTLLKEGVRNLEQRARQSGNQGRSNGRPKATPRRSSDYPGDFTGTPTITHAPQPGDSPDPGEVVWAWVPFEEDHSQGKDRPVLLIGTDGEWLLGLPLTSQDHDRDAAQEASQGRFWMDIGTGSWDRQGRASEARVDRIIRVDPGSVRRTGDALNREIFDRVADEVRRHAR